MLHSEEHACESVFHWRASLTKKGEARGGSPFRNSNPKYLVANALGAHDPAAMRPAPDDTLIVADGATMKQNRFDAGNVAAVNPLHWHRGSGRGHRNKAKHGGADSGDQ